ncbi:putative Ig domain-containing protein [Rhizobium sp. LEGMi198b]
MAGVIKGFQVASGNRQAWLRAIPSYLSGFRLLLFTALAVTIGAPTAYALSAACTTLSSVDTTSYSNSFLASAFGSGELVTVSYTDDGEDSASLPAFATDHVLVQNSPPTNAYGYNYYSSLKVIGLHSVAVTSSQLTSTGLSLIVQTGTHIGTVSIRCTGSATIPSVGNTSTTVSANSSNNAVTLSISGTASSVAVASNPAHGTASASGTAISYTPISGYSGSDSFTYTATNQGGTSAPATVTITVSAPTLALSPSAGALSSGTVGRAYSQTITASGGTAPYTYSLVSGALPSGLTLSTSGVISGTPAAAGASNFTVRATDSSTGTGPFSSTQAYSLTVTANPPIAGNATATVATNSTNNPVTLALTGGTATSVTVSTQATHGSATATGTSITYTPTAGYAGSDSFAYTAANADGSSEPAIVSVTVSVPTVSVSPTSLPSGTIATAYSQTITASGGTAPYTYAVTAGSLPAGLTLSSTGVLSGTATAAGTFNLTITATDSSAGSGPFTGSRAYTLTTNVEAPIAGNVAASVAANSTANPITLAITGGTATSVTVATAPSHGTASASGTAITYTPASGYSGADGFTYTATNATGTSVSAAVSLTVTAPTLGFSPPSGALTAGIVGAAYSQTLAVSGGANPYSYDLTGTLPAGLTLNHSTGAISGTPTISGNYGFSVTATDANSAMTSAAYTLAIAAPSATFVFSPAGGALTEAMAGEAYSHQISSTGGTGTKIYSLASGSLPDGIVLNISTGQLTGPLATGTEGDYSFSIQVRDGNGSIGTAAFTLKVKTRAVTVTDKVVDVPEGSTPSDVYLNNDATGGPFSSADMTFVEPANAGTATIIQGQLAQAGPVTTPVGWYLHYTPNSAYSGQVRVGYKLTSALGISNTGTVTYNIRYDAGKVAEDVSNLVHDFVQSRQNMIANTIEVPGLLQRRQMQRATDPVTARMTPSEQGMTLGFSTSLSQMRAVGGDADAASAPFNVWIDGAFLAHDDKSKNDDTSKWGNFAMVSLGADYLLADKALVGLSFHYDRMTDPTDEDAELTGNGWLSGPYASLELGKGVFWNGSLRYGGSSNSIDTQFWDGTFKTKRWMADTSIEGQWDLNEATTLSPKLRAIYFSEKVDDYTVKNSSGDAITIEGFDENQFRVSLGAEIARSFALESGAKLTPKLGLTGGFSGLDGSGAFGAVTVRLTLQTADFWILDTSLLFNIEGDGQKSVGAKVAAAKKF